MWPNVVFGGHRVPEGLNRRQIITASIKAKPAMLRPPWSGAAFEVNCNSCGDCIDICPRNILRGDDAGLAFIDFSHSGCDFCGECVRVCETGALAGSKMPWRVELEISGKCLAIRGIVCRSCDENCDEEAIRFRPGLNGKSYPIIDESSCNGCGSCVSPCPVRAITIKAKQMEEIHA